jgi:hypothetical protein
VASKNAWPDRLGGMGMINMANNSLERDQDPNLGDSGSWESDQHRRDRGWKHVPSSLAG